MPAVPAVRPISFFVFGCRSGRIPLKDLRLVQLAEFVLVLVPFLLRALLIVVTVRVDVGRHAAMAEPLVPVLIYPSTVKQICNLLLLEVESPLTILYVSVFALGPGGEGVALGHGGELCRLGTLLGLGHRWLDHWGLLVRFFGILSCRLALYALFSVDVVLLHFLRHF